MATPIRVPCQPPSRTPCPISFLGEAPGEEEVSKRRKGEDGKWHLVLQPFIGPAGTVFNAALQAANLDRADFHITNVFDEKAEDNECGPWLSDPERVAASAARLAEEFARYQPRVIVPLGSTALAALTAFSKIGDFRGAVIPATKIVPGAKLLPTFHPAAVIKSWKLLPLLTGDLIKAAAEARRGPAISYPRATLLVEPSLKDIREFKEICLQADLLSLDIETAWGQITNIGFAPTPDLAMNIPFLDMRKPNRSYWLTPEAETEAWLHVRDICESPVPKLGQNFTYDAMWLWLKMHIAVRNYRAETRLLHHALYPELPKSLGSMAASYTRLGSWKHWAAGKGGTDDKKDS